MEADPVRRTDPQHGEDVQILGDDSAESDAPEASLDFLPSGKRERIEELQLRTAGQLAAAMEAGHLDAATWVEIHEREEEEIEGLLNDDELFEYSVRASDSARALRALLKDVEVTEDEFRQLFVLKTTFDEEVVSRDEPGDGSPEEGPEDEEARARRKAARARAEAVLNDGFRSVLGDDRYRRFRYERALRSSGIRNVAKEYGLPRESLYRVLEIAESAREAAEGVRDDPQRTPDSRREALAALRAETEREVAGLIGGDAAQSYIETDLGLRTLNQPVVPEGVRMLTDRPAF